MPQIRTQKEKLKGFEALPAGTYEVRLDGFEPEWSKKKDSVNLRPKLTVISVNGTNDPTLCDGKHRAFDNLNSQAGWTHIEFCHGFGEMMDGEENGVPIEQWSSSDAGIPGDFLENPTFPGDPAKWTYDGPLLGNTATIEIVQVPGFKDPNKPQGVIKKYFCKVPGCRHQHLESLV